MPRVKIFTSSSRVLSLHAYNHTLRRGFGNTQCVETELTESSAIRVVPLFVSFARLSFLSRESYVRAHISLRVRWWKRQSIAVESEHKCQRMGGGKAEGIFEVAGLTFVILTVLFDDRMPAAVSLG